MDASKYITVASCSAAVSSHNKVPALLRKLDPHKAGWFLAAGLNVCVAAYVAHRAWQHGNGWWETVNNLKRLQQRLWELATQGAEAAGPVAQELGQPDEHDVYAYTSAATGTTIFFRQGWHASGNVQWEWSTDKQLWIPACHADSLWFTTDSVPSAADKVLIQQLHIEGQLIRKQGKPSSIGAGLPPLDLSNATQDITQLSQVPAAFLCPISMRIMTQPVVTPSGASFDRPAIMDWIRQQHTDPVSGHPLRSHEVYPNLVMRDMIHAWAHSQPQQKQRQQQQQQQQQQQEKAQQGWKQEP